MNYPPYSITDRMLTYVSDIMKKIGEINYITLNKKPELRKQNRINSIHSSLAIENNKLSITQVKDVIDGKAVVGDRKDIQEVKNAYNAYQELNNINPYSIEELKRVHGIMTFLIEEESGKFRTHGEGVYDNDKLIFMCPPAELVSSHMEKLFEWLNNSKDVIHPLILSSVFHYEFVFIHPFGDGNGRMAGLWQTAILSKWEKAFEYIPIESLIKKYQDDYYNAISKSNVNGNSNEFIEFMLKMMEETINELLISTVQENVQENVREKLKDIEIKILDLIKNTPEITQNIISEKLNLNAKTVYRAMASLKSKDIIRRIGSDRKGYWKVQK